jgi:hypothetical protein
MAVEMDAAQREMIRQAARLIGRLGASKGGKARALSLDAYRRFEIASMGGKAAGRNAAERRRLLQLQQGENRA